MNNNFLPYQLKKNAEQASNLATQLAQIAYNVKNYGAKGDTVLDSNGNWVSGTDDTTAINNVLSTYRGYEIYIPAGIYTITSDLIIYNNTKLRLHPQAQIFLKPGVTNGNYSGSWNGLHLLKNDLTNGTQNIIIDGGIWNGNGLNYAHDSQRGFRLENITGLTIQNMKMMNVNGWGLNLGTISKFQIRNIEFDQIEGVGQNGDGVHLSSSNDGIVENIYGYTNDDMVALFAGDTVFTSQSNMNNIIIRNLRPKMKGSTNCYKAVAIYAQDGYKVDNIIVDDIVGNTYAPIVIIANGKPTSSINPNAYFGKITINNVTGNTTNDRQPFNIDMYGQTGGDNAQKVIIDSLIINNYQRTKVSSDLNSQPILQLNHTNINNLVLTNFNDQYDGNSGQLINSTYSNIENLLINGVKRKQITTGQGTNPLGYFTNVTATVIDIGKVSDIILSNTTPLLQVDPTCTIQDFRLSGISRQVTTGSPSPAASLLFIHASSVIYDLSLENINIVFADNSNASAIYQYGKVYQATLNNVKNYSKTLPNPISVYTKNSSDSTVVTLLKMNNIYTGTYFVGYGNLTITAGKIRAHGLDVVCDPTTITDPQNGDMVRNKAGGMSRYNGTAWTIL
jgi:hypothetical protein